MSVVVLYGIGPVPSLDGRQFMIPLYSLKIRLAREISYGIKK